MKNPKDWFVPLEWQDMALRLNVSFEYRVLFHTAELIWTLSRK